MKIIQISVGTLPDCYREPIIVMGLGDDNNVYTWDTAKGEWILDKQENVKIENI